MKTGTGHLVAVLSCLVLLSVATPRSRAETLLGTVSVGRNPTCVAVNAAANRAYVANSYGNSLTVLNATTGALVTTVALGASPYGIALNAAAGRLYVANGPKDTVSVISTVTNAVVSTFTAPGFPYALRFNPANGLLYVANADANTVSVLEPTTGALVASVSAGSFPRAVAVDAVRNRVYVANGFDESVSAIDGNTNAEVGRIRVGRSPVDLDVNATTGHVYVANSGGNSVTIINGATNAVLRTLAVGASPRGVAANGSNNRTYIVNSGGNSVSVVDGAAQSVIATVSAGAFPFAAAVNPAAARLFVANNGAGSVSLYDMPAGASVVATRLVYQRQPAGAVAATAFATQPIVVAQDAAGNTATTFAGAITVAIKSGTGTAGATLGGTATVNAVNGVATFGNLSVSSSGSGYILTASSTALTGVDSSPFTVSAPAVGTPVKVVFQRQPSGATANAPFGTQPVVAVQDANGNVVTSFSGAVTVGLERWSGTSGAVVKGTTTVGAVNGIATFTNLSIDLVGTGYLLWAASSGLTASDSAAFNVTASVTPGVPTKVVFQRQPAGAVAGAPFLTQPIVVAQDANGNVATSFNGTVSVGIERWSGTTGAVLRGTVSVKAVDGVAVFSNLSIDRSGVGYLLWTAASGLTASDSAPFDVSALTALDGATGFSATM